MAALIPHAQSLHASQQIRFSTAVIYQVTYIVNVPNL